MGLGDWLMAAGEARRIHARTGSLVCIVDAFGRPVRQGREIWSGTPYIVNRVFRGVTPLVNCGGHRPYIEAKSDERWTWRDYTPIPADLFLTPAENAWSIKGRGRIVLAPAIKATASPNKQWPMPRWRQLADRLRTSFRLIQFPSAAPIADVPIVHTPTIRCAAAVLRASDGAVLHEGGLHHIAAAVGRPSVVIYGGFISPKQTGYPMHTNLFTGGKPCGMRTPCGHCHDAMNAITVDAVVDALKGIL